MVLPTPWLHTSSLQNSEKINFCCHKATQLLIVCYVSPRKLTVPSWLSVANRPSHPLGVEWVFSTLSRPLLVSSSYIWTPYPCPWVLPHPQNLSAAQGSTHTRLSTAPKWPPEQERIRTRVLQTPTNHQVPRTAQLFIFTVSNTWTCSILYSWFSHCS